MANTATSMYFVDDGGRVGFSDGPDKRFTFGLGNFTIEFWGQNTDASNTVGWFNYFVDSNNRYHLTNYSSLDFYSVLGGSSSNLALTHARDTQWHHYAVVRSGTHLGIWVDGTLIASKSNYTINLSFSGGTMLLGVRTDNGSDFTSYSEDVYMDEFRVSKSARYGNFDIPIAYLSSHQTAGRGKNTLLPYHTVLHISSETATDGSTTFFDKTGNHTITATNGASHEDTYSLPWGNTAINLTGTKYITASNMIYWPGNSNNWSLEMWYLTTGLNSSDVPFEYGNYTQSGSLMLQSYGGGDFRFFTGGSTPSGMDNIPTDWAGVGVWRHLAMVGNGGGFTFYVDGQVVKHTSTQITLEEKDLRIGADIHGSAAGPYVADQYVDDVRLCIGQSAYTPHFTPYGGQKNVVHNRGGAVTDARLASANTHAIQMGRPAIGSDAATNANTYCLDFDGTDDYLIHTTPTYRSSDDRGTIFAWIYLDTIQAGIIFASMDTAGGGSHYDWLYLRVNGSGKLDITKRHNDGTQSPGATSLSDSTLSTGQWYSVAVVADGTNNWVLYVDGTAVSITTSGAAGENGNWLADLGSTDNITIGAYKYGAGTGDFFDGKIMQVAYFGGSVGSQGVLTAAQIAALHSAGKGHDLTTATGVYTASEIDDLKGYWRMGNHHLDTAACIYDASGNAYDMKIGSTPLTQTFSGTTTFTGGWRHRGYFTPDKYTSLLIQSSTNNSATNFEDTGPGFKKLNFNGTDAYLATGSTTYRQSDKSGSFATWVKWGGIASPATNSYLCSFTTATNYFYFYVRTSDFYIDYRDDGTDSSRTAGATASGLTGGQWEHFVVTQSGDPDDPDPFKIYINGSKVVYNPTDHNAKAHHLMWFDEFNPTNVVIGAFQHTGGTISQPFNGQMSQFAIWGGTDVNSTGVLSASDVSALYALGPNGNVKTDYSTGLVDYWTMGNLTGEGDDLVTSGTLVYSQVSASGTGGTTTGNDLNKGGTISAPFAGHTIVVGGDTKHKTDKSVFGGSSIYFDGTGDYLQVADTGRGNDFNIWAAEDVDSSVEAWCYFDADPGTATHTIASTWPVGSPATAWEFRTDGASLNMNITVSGTVIMGITGNQHGMSVKRWHHCAFTKNGSLGTVLIDGIPIDSATGTAYATVGFDDTLDIGRRAYHNDLYFHGYMDEIRISTGIARYSKSIERFANTFVAKGDTGDAFTALQIQSNGAKNGTSYTDNLNRTGYNTSTVTITGSPIWKNTVGDGFGGANTALYFDGTDILQWADSSDWDFASDASVEYTLEAWVYIPSRGYSQTDSGTDNLKYMLFAQYEDVNNHWMINSYTDTGTWRFSVYTGGGAVVDLYSDKHFGIERWEHLVLQKASGGVWQFYQDGVLTGSTTDTSTDSYSGALYIGKDFSAGAYKKYKGYIDQFRFSKGIARYGKIQLRTTQQTHVSANSDSGVVTSNSTFGSGDNIFSTDGHTALLLNADEGYSNTHVAASANAFLSSVGNTNVSNVTTTYTVTVASGQRLDGTTGNIYYINGYGRPALTLVRDNHYIIRGARTVIGPSPASDGGTNGAHPFKFATGANGPEYTTGVVQEYSGTDALYKISPTSATPDSLHYYCGLHNNMGFTISVVDSTGSDGLIAPTPIGVTKADGTTTANFPTQRQGISAYGANSYFFDGTNDYLKATTIRPLMTDTWRDNGFCGEMWLYPLSASSDGVCSFIKVDDSNHLHMRFHNTHGFVVSFDSASGQVEILDSNNDEFCKGLVNSWYHVAVQITNADDRSDQELQLWINGNLFLSKSMSDKHFDASSAASAIFGWDDSNYYYGYMDGIRLSNKERINYTSSNAKLGTNAVHHSHVKLLITSNTVDGNTHFDDFSDQGNYWNQQPFSYFFDGTDDYITKTDPEGYPTGTNARSIAMWYRIFTGNAGGDYMLSTGKDAQYGGFGLFTGTSGDNLKFHGYDNDHNLSVEDGNSTNGGWHLYVATANTAASATDQLITAYHDGISAMTNTNRAVNSGPASDTQHFRIGARYGSASDYTKMQACAAAGWNVELTAAAVQKLWEAGPTANWTEQLSSDSPGTAYTSAHRSGLFVYYAMGNHNDLAGRPADTASTVYDRSGNGNDGTTSGSMDVPMKGIDISASGNIKHSTDVKNFGSSSIFFDGTGDYLSLPDIGEFDFSGNFTIEMWINVSSIANYDGLITFDGTGSADLALGFGSGDSKLHLYSNAGTASSVVNSGDTINLNTWHHIAVNRSNSVTTFMLNGILKSSGTYSTSWTTGSNGVKIGRFYAADDEKYFHGYMDEIAIYNGAAKYKPVVTGLGTSTITPSYLSDPTGNHFTPTALAITDQMLDTPENNFCTLNSLVRNQYAYSEGNLKIKTAVDNSFAWGTMAGKMDSSTQGYYFEMKVASSATLGSGGAGHRVGVASYDAAVAHGIESDGGWGVGNDYLYGIQNTTGTYVLMYGSGTTGPSTGIAAQQGDFLQIAWKNGKIWIGLNGVFFDSGGGINGDPAKNSAPTHTVGTTYITEDWMPFIASSLTTGAVGCHFNFGQGDPDGENNFTDGNGRGGFRFEPPQGFVSLCTTNLKDTEYAPIGPNSATGTPDEHFDTLLYTDAYASGRPNKVGGLNFKPDFIWIKAREGTESHSLNDTVRGAGRILYSSGTNAEGGTGIAEFTEDGFVGSAGAGADGDGTGHDFVAWCWKAGNDTTRVTTNLTNCSDVTQSVNVDAGFAITRYKSTTSASVVFPHNLGKTPEWIIVKNRDDTNSWMVWHKDLTAGNNNLRLDTAAAMASSGSGYINAPTSTLINLEAGGGNVAGSGTNYICYAWTGIEGYSKFGSYEGNNNDDGPFIYTGFRPAFVMVKDIDASANWEILDSKRNPNNPVNERLFPSNTDAASTGENTFDFLSNGFKVRDTYSGANSSTTHIYMAFAEMPFKYANAR